MRGHYTQYANVRCHHSFHQHPLHAGCGQFRLPRQQMPPNLTDGKPGKNGIAKKATPATAIRYIRCYAVDRRVAGQSSQQLSYLVFTLAARQTGKINRDFLQANDIEVAQLMNRLENARKINPSIHAASPLNIPG